ncbi:MAG: DNA-directed RNA polymerase subunit omega [Synergistaceae bacterium]|nr:DNA-directed RNA polymerase subunit omega [Synergistaceae bacterium]
MIFYDMDSLAEKQGIDNKYLLTAAVAAWARTLSERKGRTLEEDNEKFISTALQGFDEGLVKILEDGEAPEKEALPEEADHALVEE